MESKIKRPVENKRWLWDADGAPICDIMEYRSCDRAVVGNEIAACINLAPQLAACLESVYKDVGTAEGRWAIDVMLAEWREALSAGDRALAGEGDQS